MTAHALLQRLTAQLGGVLQGQAPAIRLVAAAFASGGHVLLEDYPGTGKTTLAKALAISLGLHFQRVQFTPDLLPMDILGVNIYEPAQQGFRLHRGPIFTQILLADEINRASPRTQAALIEAMAERQVSLDGTCHPLDPLFFVIATQNPVEFHGTYPLPEAQLDRFALCFRLGYVTPAEECAILQAQRHRHPLDDLAPCLSAAESASLPAAAAAVAISPELLRYIVALVGETRHARGVVIGASPRASLILMKTAQALALYDGGEFVTPDHIQELAVPAIAHRLVLDSEAKFAGRTGAAVVADCLAAVPVPR